MKQSYIIGITGGSGSGKTTILKKIKQQFQPGEVCIVSQDDYYKLRETQKVDKNGIINFDLPTAVELDQLFHDLQKLIDGKTIHRKEYTFNNEKKTPSVKEFIPAPIIIVEGLFVFTHEKLRTQFDLKIFVEAHDHLKIIRRIKRDKIERNYPLDDVLYRYEHHVQPAYEKYIRPYKDDADVIINNNTHYRKGLLVLSGFLNNYLDAIPAENKGAILEEGD